MALSSHTISCTILAPTHKNTHTHTAISLFMLFLLDLHRDNRYTQLRLMEGRENLCVDRSCKCTYALLHPLPPSPKNLLSIALRYASLLLLLTPYRVRVCVCVGLVTHANPVLLAVAPAMDRMPESVTTRSALSIFCTQNNKHPRLLIQWFPSEG